MIPTPFTLQVKPYTAGTADHGSTVPAYGSPRDWHVHGWGPGAMLEAGEPNRDVSQIAYTVYAPKSEELPTERDRVTLAGKDYDVNGRPADWTNGPWYNPAAGVTVELRRIEG